GIEITTEKPLAQEQWETMKRTMRRTMETMRIGARYLAEVVPPWLAFEATAGRPRDGKGGGKTSPRLNRHFSTEDWGSQEHLVNIDAAPHVPAPLE
ncbi:MAG TPA: hypothetical protein VII40_15065, partial [Xanthobacteraceae bacterium]